MLVSQAPVILSFLCFGLSSVTISSRSSASPCYFQATRVFQVTLDLRNKATSLTLTFTCTPPLPPNRLLSSLSSSQAVKTKNTPSFFSHLSVLEPAIKKPLT